MKPLLKILVCWALVLFYGCSKQEVSPESKSHGTFTFTFAKNVTPIDRAQERYTDFRYQLRKLGESEFKTFLPVSVTPTPDGSVIAKFEIAIPEPKIKEQYETQTSYRLDGKLHRDGIKVIAFKAETVNH